MNRSRVIALSASLLLIGCGRHAGTSASAAASPPPVQVQISRVTADNVRDMAELTGVVRPVRRAQIAAKVMGTIDDIPLTLGQAVQQGDVLVKISAVEISARAAQAQSQLNAARRDLQRERDLLVKGASTSDMVRGLEDRFTAAEAMVREAEAMLGYATIRAPFDGVVARKLANTGDLASPGMPLLELEGAGEFQVEFGVPDSLADGVSRGTVAGIEIPASRSSFSGPVAELSSAADAGALTVLAKINVPANIHVRSGQFARVHVPGRAVDGLFVPAGAVTRHGQMERVFVANDANLAVLRLVKTGAQRGDRIEILAGLDRDERIVTAPPANLREGQALEVVR